MSRLIRSLLATLVLAAGVLAVTPASPAQAGVGGSATPTFPTSVTVGQTGLPASIELRNANTPPEAGLTNVVCNFGDPFPCPAGGRGITLIPACGRLGVNSICEPGFGDPGVFQITGTPTGAAGTSCAGMTFTVALINPAIGQYEFTPTAGNVMLPPLPPAPTPADFCRIDFTIDVLKMPTFDFPDGQPEPPGLPGVQTAQVTDSTQYPVGQILTGSGRGTSSGVTVNRAQPAISTTASPSITLGAGTISDTATVTGQVNPDGNATVSFSLYGPSDTTCAGPPIFTSNLIPYPTNGGPVTSAPYTPTVAGTYRWIASYSGDVNNAPVSGACNDANENVVVTKANPTIATTASPTIALGTGTLTDNATVSGLISPQAGATVTFNLYGPNDTNCTGASIFTSTVPYPVTGGAVTSGAFTPTSAGTYRWIAAYSGDANNNAVSGACNDTNENVDVTKANPAIATQASPPIALGAGTLTDTATVTGLVSPQAGATIDFRLYGPDDATCTNAPVFQSLGVAYPVSGGPVTSLPFTPTAAGTYRWIASYSGDANNNAVSGACNDANENVVVFPSSPTITTTASGTVALGAGALTDVAVVTDRVNPQAGATITFNLYGPNDANCAGAIIFTSTVPYPVAGGPVTSGAFTPQTVGIYRWIAIYSGDANNPPVSGACNDPGESTDVTRANPAIATTASPTVVAGVGLISDQAVVTGLVNAQVGGTVDFRLYGPNDDNCQGAPIFQSLGIALPTNGGPVTSGSFLPQLPGTYRWIASYSGDANNNPVSGACNDANENVIVTTPDSSVPGLPETGTSIAGFAQGAGAVIALGATLLILATRRRRPLHMATVRRR